MSLKQAGVWSSAFAAASLAITALPSQSFRIKNVYIDGASNSPAYAQLQIQNTTVGYFRADGNDFNNLFLAENLPGECNILGQLRKKKYFDNYPVASGETFTVSLSAGTADILIEYDIYDTADVKDTDPNGISASELVQVLYGTIGEIVSAAGYKKVDTSLMPAGYINFPFAENFPSNYSGQLLAMMSQSVEENNYSGAANNYAATEYTRLTLDQTVLFDQQENGFPTQGTGAAAGSANTVYNKGANVMPWICPNVTKDLYFFEPPVPLVAGNNLIVEQSVTLSDGAASLAADDTNVALIVALKKVK